MKISFTKSKTKYALAATLLLLTVLSFAFSSLFSFHFSKWIILPMLAVLELIVLALLLFKIELPSKLNKICTVLFLIIFPLISLVYVEFLQKSMHLGSFKAYAVNYMMFLAAYLFVSVITTQVKYGIFVMAPLSFLIGVINHYVLAFRGTPMQPWDIAAAKTAMNVVDNFIFTLDEYVLISLFIMLILALCALYLKPEKLSKKARIYSLGTAAVVMVICISIPTYLISGNRGKFERDLWNQTISSKNNGYVTNFLLNLQLMSNEAPENYSVDTINTILADYVSDGAKEDLPNIIVIMNEAFADLEAIEDFGLEEDYMPFVHSLSKAENAVTGNLNVSIFGGGTCNTEYEFLSSNISGMLRSGSYPMQQFVNDDSVSIASNLKTLGYKTVGVHPYYGSGWNRSRAYPLLGFDQFLTIDDFDESTEMIREYVSDRACYEKIMHISEHTTSQPLFLFAVTMQNHGGYETEWSDMPNNIIFLNENNYQQTNRYVELAKISDDAFKELIEYYSNDERDTIILFFGDHQPSLGNEYGELFSSTKSKDLSSASKQYFVPFVLWANFDIEEERIENISPNYLAPLLLEKAKMPQTAYQKYLNDLRKKIPSITTIACVDQNGELFTLEENKEYADELLEYDILQYNNVFDQNNLVSEKFMYSLS